MQHSKFVGMTRFSYEIQENLTAAESAMGGGEDMPVRLKAKVPDVFDHLETLIEAQDSNRSVAEILVELGTPIVSIGVLDAGNTTTKIIGSSKPRAAKSILSAAKPFNNDTIFQACSISKSITALAVMKLCQEGKLALDTSICRYLTPEQFSWICTPATHKLASQITLRHLLSHTSGLSVHGFAGYSTGKVPSIQQILTGSPPANHEPISLLHIPGQKYSYSGGGFTVIQLVLEMVLRKPHYQILDEIVLRPLNMTRSTFKLLHLDGVNYAPSYLSGKLKADPDHHALPESAAAGLWTTPGDLLKAVRAVQRSLKSDGFLERAWAEDMLAEVKDNGMALGWRATKGGQYFYHTGSNAPGYRSFFAGYAELKKENTGDGEDTRNRKGENTPRTGNKRRTVPKDCGIAVMANSALGDRAIGKILSAIAYLKGWPDVSSAYMEVPFMDRQKSIDDRAKQWCGTWGPGSWSLVDEDGLFVKFGTSVKLSLVPAAISPNVYEEGTSIDLVVDGLEMMLRLGWKEGSRIIELWQDCGSAILERQ